MEENPLISVIIPVYNSANYIVQSATSVLNCGEGNIELILVDDGSADNSFSVCKEIAEKDERVKLFHKENGGASSARNYGLERARGEYVYFVDSDDFIEENALHILAEKALESGADVIYFEAYNFSETEEIKAKEKGFTFNCRYEEERGEELIPKLIKNKDYHAAPFLYFIKRELIEDIRFEEGIMFEDELFSFMLLIKAEKVLCLNEKFYRRRMREGSVMTTAGKGVFRFNSISTVLERLINTFGDLKTEASKKYIERIAVLWQLRYEELSFSEREEVSERYKNLREEIEFNGYFSSKQIKLRLKSKALWRIYTLPSKVFGKIKKIFKRK